MEASSSHEMDLLSFDDTIGNTLTQSAASSLRNPFCGSQSVLAMARSHREKTILNSGNVNVQVGGVAYSIPREAFQKLSKLPWVPITSCYVGSNNSVLQLSTSPDIFEILMNHIMYKILPNYDSLCKTEIEELKPMAIILELNELVDYLTQRKEAKKLRSQLRQKFSMKSERSDSSLVLAENNTSLNVMRPAYGKCSRLVNGFRKKVTHAEVCKKSAHIN